MVMVKGVATVEDKMTPAAVAQAPVKVAVKAAAVPVAVEAAVAKQVLLACRHCNIAVLPTVCTALENKRFRIYY